MWLELDETELLLQSFQFGTLCWSEETEVTHLDKALRENVLEKAMDESFNGEGRMLDLASIGRTIEKSDLGSFQ